jgi:glycosyltransferase involved in cell wall biosynthesis
MGPLVGARAEGGFARRVRLEGRGIAHAAGVSAPSEDVLRRTKDHYRLTLKDAVVIPNPVPERPMDKRWTLEASDRNQILFVGRFDGHKGGDTIIDAFAMIAGRNRKACLAFVGPDRGFTDSKGKRWQIHQYMAHRISDPSARERVEYLGFKPPEEIEELRRRAMVTVVCSRYETFSMTAAEAMAGGCPIVATNTGGLAELIQHESNGLLCRPNDPSDLATKILSILDHPEMAASLGAQAARDAASRYHPNIVAQQSIEFYREVLARSHRNNSRK